MEECGRELSRKYKDYKGPKTDPHFRQTVILCAEQNGNRIASEMYGVPYSTLRRWRRFREDIFGDEEDLILPHGIGPGTAQIALKRFLDGGGSIGTRSTPREDEVPMYPDRTPKSEIMTKTEELFKTWLETSVLIADNPIPDFEVLQVRAINIFQDLKLSNPAYDEAKPFHASKTWYINFVNREYYEHERFRDLKRITQLETYLPADAVASKHRLIAEAEKMLKPWLIRRIEQDDYPPNFVAVQNKIVYFFKMLCKKKGLQPIGEMNFQPTRKWFEGFKKKAGLNEFYFEEEGHGKHEMQLLQDRLQPQLRSKDSPSSTASKSELPAANQHQNSLRNQPSPQINGPVKAPPPDDQDKDPDEVCLRWNSHHTNMKSTFPSLRDREKYVDVTLSAEGKTLRCHKLILSSCSAYFDEVLSGITPLQHPVIFIKGIPFWILKALIDFMYVGEVHIEQARLQEILEAAEALKIKGLTGKAPQNPEPKPEQPSTPIKTEASQPATPTPTPPPPTPVKIQQKPPTGPVRLAVTKEQATKMQIEDPLSLLRPAFYEENVPSANPAQKRMFVPIRPKMDGAAELAFKKDWLTKKIAPKKKLKRRVSEHEPSPPPVILRKGTKSRPIVKAPKYYHMEFEEKEAENKDSKTEEEPVEPPVDPPPLIIDVASIKPEPADIDMDIEENDVNVTEEYPQPEEEENPPIDTRIQSPPRDYATDGKSLFEALRLKQEVPEEPPDVGEEGPIDGNV